MRQFLMMFVIAPLAFTVMASATEIENAGKNGNNSRQLLARFDSDVRPKRPDLIVLGGGTNDAINSRNAVPLPEYLNNVRSLVEKSRAAGARVLLITPVPCIDAYVLQRHSAAFFGETSPTQRIEAYVAALLKLGDELGIPVVNLYQLFQDNGNPGESADSWLQNELNSGRKDGVHPTAVGYRAIADEVCRQMLSENEQPQRVLCLGDSITYGAGSRTGDRDESYPAFLRQLINATLPQNPDR